MYIFTGKNSKTICKKKLISESFYYESNNSILKSNMQCSDKNDNVKCERTKQHCMVNGSLKVNRSLV